MMPPFITAWQRRTKLFALAREIDANLAARKLLRAYRQDAARRGVETRRANHG